MKVIGWITTGVAAGVVVALLAAGAMSIPDIRRYLQMRRM